MEAVTHHLLWLFHLFFLNTCAVILQYPVWDIACLPGASRFINATYSDGFTHSDVITVGDTTSSCVFQSVDNKSWYNYVNILTDKPTCGIVKLFDNKNIERYYLDVVVLNVTSLETGSQRWRIGCDFGVGQSRDVTGAFAFPVDGEGIEVITEAINFTINNPGYLRLMNNNGSEVTLATVGDPVHLHVEFYSNTTVYSGIQVRKCLIMASKGHVSSVVITDDTGCGDGRLMPSNTGFVPLTQYHSISPIFQLIKMENNSDLFCSCEISFCLDSDEYQRCFPDNHCQVPAVRVKRSYGHETREMTEAKPASIVFSDFNVTVRVDNSQGFHKEEIITCMTVANILLFFMLMFLCRSVWALVSADKQALTEERVLD